MNLVSADRCAILNEEILDMIHYGINSSPENVTGKINDFVKCVRFGESGKLDELMTKKFGISGFDELMAKKFKKGEFGRLVERKVNEREFEMPILIEPITIMTRQFNDYVTREILFYIAGNFFPLLAEELGEPIAREFVEIVVEKTKTCASMKILSSASIEGFERLDMITKRVTMRIASEIEPFMEREFSELMTRKLGVSNNFNIIMFEDYNSLSESELVHDKFIAHFSFNKYYSLLC